jgi:hypothetical protein
VLVVSQNPLHYVREEVLPHLRMVIATADKDYAEWSVKDTFARLPWAKAEIGDEVRKAWKERFGSNKA